MFGNDFATLNLLNLQVILILPYINSVLNSLP